MDQLQAMWLARALAETAWMREDRKNKRTRTSRRSRLFRRGTRQGGTR